MQNQNTSKFKQTEMDEITKWFILGLNLKFRMPSFSKFNGVLIVSINHPWFCERQFHQCWSRNLQVYCPFSNRDKNKFAFAKELNNLIKWYGKFVKVTYIHTSIY